MGYLDGKADSREQYLEAWHSHLKDFKSVLGQANIPVSEWEEHLAPMRAIIEKAADSAFPVPKLTDAEVKMLEDDIVDDGVFDVIVNRIDWLLEDSRYDDIAQKLKDAGDGSYIQWSIVFEKEIYNA